MTDTSPNPSPEVSAAAPSEAPAAATAEAPSAAPAGTAEPQTPELQTSQPQTSELQTAAPQTAAPRSAEPPPSFVKLAMRNMVRKGRQSLLHFGLTAVGFIGFILLVAWFGRPTLPQ